MDTFLELTAQALSARFEVGASKIGQEFVTFSKR